LVSYKLRMENSKVGNKNSELVIFIKSILKKDITIDVTLTAWVEIQKYRKKKNWWREYQINLGSSKRRGYFSFNDMKSSSSNSAP